jgi:hypothetical protein
MGFAAGSSPAAATNTRVLLSGSAAVSKDVDAGSVPATRASFLPFRA